MIHGRKFALFLLGLAATLLAACGGGDGGGSDRGSSGDGSANYFPLKLNSTQHITI